MGSVSLPPAGVPTAAWERPVPILTKRMRKLRVREESVEPSSAASGTTVVAPGTAPGHLGLRLQGRDKSGGGDLSVGSLIREAGPFGTETTGDRGPYLSEGSRWG